MYGAKNGESGGGEGEAGTEEEEGGMGGGLCNFFFFFGEEKFVVKYKNYRLFNFIGIKLYFIEKS